MKAIIRKWARGRAASIKPPAKQVAIMVPLPTATLGEDDKVSMRHLRTHLDHYDKFLLVPEGLGVEMEGFSVVELEKKHFGSAANHNRMLYRTDFWEIFADYEYVLMYHLDALVFSDQRSEWCGKGLDYIGSPFLNCEDSPWVKEARVGNGGFALYRVSSVLKVLWNRYQKDPAKYYEDHWWKAIEFQGQILKPIRAAVPRWMRGRATAPLVKTLRKLDHIEVNEKGNDEFWSDQAKVFFPDFKVASLEEGLRFSFEVAPTRCLEMNQGRMPFGCHAWARYDRKFWEPHLLPAEEDAPPTNGKHHQ